MDKRSSSTQLKLRQFEFPFAAGVCVQVVRLGQYFRSGEGFAFNPTHMSLQLKKLADVLGESLPRVVMAACYRP